MLTVLNKGEPLIATNGRKYVRWQCACDCGNILLVCSDALRRGTQISCGCYRKAKASRMFSKHGCADTRLYGAWSSMKSRCSNPNVYEYRYYGARGIRVCDEWMHDFASFSTWAHDHGYVDGASRGECTIDRIDCSGDYSPDNCRIITQKEQMSNIRSNHFLEMGGEVHTISEWSRITGIDARKISNRINRLGWTPERALTTA